VANGSVAEGPVGFGSQVRNRTPASLAGLIGVRNIAHAPIMTIRGLEHDYPTLAARPDRWSQIYRNLVGHSRGFGVSATGKADCQIP
jgi:hypothetical protein